MSESITDELREYTEKQIKWLDMTKVHYRKLLAIADRIDAEHERQLEVLYRDMSDAEYVKLPKDADGEYIHIGDRMENNERVARIVLTDDSWEPSVYLEKLPNVLHEYFCNEISHYHAPTVEDVLREFAFQIGQSTTDDDIVAEYAAKLRLKEDE